MNNDPESWLLIAENNDYAISSHGRVRRLTRAQGTRPGHILSPRKARGYKYVNIAVNGKKKSLKIHRLVAVAFLVPPPSPLHHSAHINGDTDYNHFTNLKWATVTENNRDKQLHGTQTRGESQHKARLKEMDIPEIRVLSKTLGPTAIAKLYGVRKGTIQFLLSGQTWKHVA